MCLILLFFQNAQFKTLFFLNYPWHNINKNKDNDKKMTTIKKNNHNTTEKKYNFIVNHPYIMYMKIIEMEKK